MSSHIIQLKRMRPSVDGDFSKFLPQQQDSYNQLLEKISKIENDLPDTFIPLLASSSLVTIAAKIFAVSLSYLRNRS
jgi:hypothetical protein